MSHSDHSHDKTKPFSVSIFIITILTSLVVSLATVALVSPTVFKAQSQASLLIHILTFLGCHLFNGLFEHPFHRYVLHSPMIPGLSTFWKSHTRHHALTHIVWQKEKGVRNMYPIVEEKQHEDSYFPWYSFGAFALVLTVPFSLIQWTFPTVPIFLDGFLALAWSISLYEIIHAFEHKSLEKWLPFLEHQNRFVRWVTWKAYTFHLRHHADTGSNENISGFFGFPVADWLFGTLVYPSTRFPHGTQVDSVHFESPRPIFLIRWLDRWAEHRYMQRRERMKGVNV